MFSAEEMARVYREDMPVLARDGAWQGEWTLQTRDGTEIPAWVTHHVHPEASEEHAYVTGTMRDLRKPAGRGTRAAGERADGSPPPRAWRDSAAGSGTSPATG